MSHFIRGWHAASSYNLGGIIRNGLLIGGRERHPSSSTPRGLFGRGVYVALDRQTAEWYGRAIRLAVTVELPSPDAIDWLAVTNRDWPWGRRPTDKPCAGVLDRARPDELSSLGGNQLVIYDLDEVKVHVDRVEWVASASGWSEPWHESEPDWPLVPNFPLTTDPGRITI